MGGTAGWLVGLPVAKLTAAVVVVAGITTALTWPSDAASRPGTAAPPSPPPSAAAPTPGTLRLGPMSLESGAVPGRYLGTAEEFGVLAGADARGRATFEAVPGLADATCYSFRAADGRFLRHQSWRLRLSQDEGSHVFRGDATFCPLVTDDGQVFLESANYRGYFIHRQDDQLWVDQADGSAAFRADSAFRVRPPLS